MSKHTQIKLQQLMLSILKHTKHPKYHNEIFNHSINIIGALQTPNIIISSNPQYTINTITLLIQHIYSITMQHFMIVQMLVIRPEFLTHVTCVLHKAHFLFLLFSFFFSFIFLAIPETLCPAQSQISHVYISQMNDYI